MLNKKSHLLIFGLFIMLLLNKSFAEVESEDNVPDKRPEIASERKDIDASKSVIVDIMSKKPFKEINEKKVWNFEKEDKDEEDNSNVAWLAVMADFISVIVEATLWLVPFVIVFYLYRYREYWLNIIQGKKPAQKDVELAETLFGLDIRRDSLPDNIESSALQLWKKDQHREAISLLYRGSLAALFKEYQFDLPSGATEQDCIHQLTLNAQFNSNDGSSESQLHRFIKLTDVWVSVAYAHRLPDEVLFNEICKDWNHYFTHVKVNK